MRPVWKTAVCGGAAIILGGIFQQAAVHAQTPERTERLTVRPDIESATAQTPASRLQVGPSPRSLAITPDLRRQLEAIGREKRSWTPRQRKIGPRLLMEYKRRMGMTAQIERFPGAPVAVEPDDTTLVDIKGNVTPEVLQGIRDRGGVIINSHPRYRAIRARIPIDQVEDIADSPDIQNIRPADRAKAWVTNVSEGDVAHRANTGRSKFGVTGAGKKTCVLSDSARYLAQVQATGDLPPVVNILPGQAGPLGTGEGTAMMEIVHDLAPDSELWFATAFTGQAQFAQNIRDLRFVAGCDVIVDDVFYFLEPVFQDGIISKAVDDVVADGALYFSSIGNGNNLNDFSPNSGTWEGDFSPGFDFGAGVGVSHDWLLGFNLNAIAFSPADAIVLQWSDPLGASASDYDLYIVDPAITTVVAASVNRQSVANGSDPFEIISLPIPGLPADLAGYWILVVKFSGANRMIHLNTFGGLLGVGTDGNAVGHATARGAIGVAAIDASDAGGGSFFGSGANQVEFFSSDGPRRIHYENNGTPITPGNFSSTGGELRQKPDITAADGIATATPGFNPFFGTSAAAPHAAAIATLMLSAPSKPSPQAVRETMFKTAIDIEASGIDRDSGHGIVDAFAMLDLPDLIAQWIKLKPGCPGAPTPCLVKGRLVLANQGFANAATESTARIYYSSDAILNPAGDIQLAQFPVSPLAAGSIQVNPVKLSVPSVTNDTSGATVYVLLDVIGDVSESDELNNQTDNDVF